MKYNWLYRKLNKNNDDGTSNTPQSNTSESNKQPQDSESTKPKTESKTEPTEFPSGNQGQDSESTKSKTEPTESPSGNQSQDSEKPLTAADVVKLVSSLIAQNNSKRPETFKQIEQPETSNSNSKQMEQPEVTDSKPESPKVSEESKLLRELIIKAAEVPAELKPVLPEDLGKLKNYLESNEYKQLKSALTIKPAATNNPTPAAPPKDKNKKEPKIPTKFSEVGLDHLKLFDNL